MNSKILVAVQFVSIGMIMLPKHSIMITPFWWELVLVAMVMAMWIFFHNKVGNFNIVPEIKENAKLITTGPYRYVRHPMYSALILFMLGIVLWHFNWINVVCFFIMMGAIVFKAFKEESLWHNHHDRYAAYKKSTKMILPFIL